MSFGNSYRHALLASTVAAIVAASPAAAQSRAFNVPAQAAAQGIQAFAEQADVQILIAEADTHGRRTGAVRGAMTVTTGLNQLLAGSGLSIMSNDGRTISLAVRPPVDAAVDGGDLDQTATQADDEDSNRDIIVTAQKFEQRIQDVPMAITALSSENMNDQKIETGADIMRAVPNLTFSKNNFSGYNISIRGIGTKSISVSSDAGVAVSFNNIGLIRNRFFEQEFFDMERVEVLRGPQGTLYGRNATGGVVNLITAKPGLDRFEGSIKGEVGNYDSRRLVGMLNVPIVTDVLGLRIAGSVTQRNGYDFNSVTNNQVNGRDLYSIRTTLRFEPSSSVRANLVWERFREDDDRARTGKQLCHRDAGPDTVGSTPVASVGFPEFNELRSAFFSTGCKAGSLYDDDAFGTPNGLALSYVAGISVVSGLYSIGSNADGESVPLVAPIDPYGGLMQSRNLREIASFRDPLYRAKSDILAFNLEVDLTPALTFSSQTALNWDNVYSFQDYNRFNTQPIFNDTSNLFAGSDPSPYRGMAPGGVFCDPQIGCSNTIGTFDVSSADSEQFAQELRLQSSFSGPFNFSVGGNYTRYKTQEDYYIMGNLLTALSMMGPFNFSGSQTTCSYLDYFNDAPVPVPIENSYCPYIDPNPVESINGQGHNYYRSSNPYKLESWAAFGEAYYNIDPNLKLTAGLRYTKDSKTFTPVPTQLLLAPSLGAGGYIGTGYPAEPDIKLSWGEFTGRFGLDWKPQLDFTDDTLLYAFFSRGYKGGGMNPPSLGVATPQQYIDYDIMDQATVDIFTTFGFLPVLSITGQEYGETFEPEFINAFEIGTKNVLMGRRLTLNASAFFYDYKDYQVSQIRNRTAVNENFDATVWGAELQAEFEPVDRLRLNANIGWLGTRIGKGEKSIDPMNRNLGDPNYIVFKPWVQLPSNCVVPTHIAESWLQLSDGYQYSWQVCGGVGGLVGGIFGRSITDPLTGEDYDPANYPELNGGSGLNTDLSGNELPNSPHWTVNLGAEYTVPFDGDWSATIRGDGYWQDKSWARTYNLDPFDRLRSWTNFNLLLRVNGPDDLSIEVYVKNVFNSTPITDAFLNSDDSGLTTNVFILDPRIIGFSIAKRF